MTVLKRPDRKQRPYYYKFMLDGVLHKEAGFRTEREARDAEAQARIKAASETTRLEFCEAVKLRLEYLQAYHPKTLRANITRLGKFGGWWRLDCSEITTEMIRQRLIELRTTFEDPDGSRHKVTDQFPPIWMPGQVVKIGLVVKPTFNQDYFYYCSEVSGDAKSGASEPSWDKITKDGSVIWKRINGPMRPAYVNKHLIALKSVFQLQFEEGRLPRNPCRSVKMLPVEKFVKYIPPIEDIEQVLAMATELDRAYLTVIWQCAARVREINNLTWEDVNFQRRQVRLWTRKKKGGNLTDRLVDMTDRCFAALKKAQWLRNKHSPYVFTNPDMTEKYQNDPKRWNYDYRDKFFDRLCRLAGVRECGYHALRHARASEMADQGMSLVYIKELLGHEDISTTSIYLQSLGIKSLGIKK